MPILILRLFILCLFASGLAFKTIVATEYILSGNIVYVPNNTANSKFNISANAINQSTTLFTPQDSNLRQIKLTMTYIYTWQIPGSTLETGIVTVEGTYLAPKSLTPANLDAYGTVVEPITASTYNPSSSTSIYAWNPTTNQWVLSLSIPEGTTLGAGNYFVNHTLAYIAYLKSSTIFTADIGTYMLFLNNWQYNPPTQDQITNNSGVQVNTSADNTQTGSGVNQTNNSTTNTTNNNTSETQNNTTNNNWSNNSQNSTSSNVTNTNNTTNNVTNQTNTTNNYDNRVTNNTENNYVENVTNNYGPATSSPVTGTIEGFEGAGTPSDMQGNQLTTIGNQGTSTNNPFSQNNISGAPAPINFSLQPIWPFQSAAPSLYYDHNPPYREVIRQCILALVYLSFLFVVYKALT